MAKLTCARCGGVLWRPIPMAVQFGPTGGHFGFDFAEQCAGCGLLAARPPRPIEVEKGTMMEAYQTYLAYFRNRVGLL